MANFAYSYSQNPHPARTKLLVLAIGAALLGGWLWMFTMRPAHPALLTASPKAPATSALQQGQPTNDWIVAQVAISESTASDWIVAGGRTVLTNQPGSCSPVPGGRPIDPLRVDWVITQGNAAHWRNEGLGGLDFAFYSNTDAVGSPIHATHPGIALPFKDFGDGTGKGNGVWVYGYVDPQTGLSYNTLYGHFSKMTALKGGEQVTCGQYLGPMGSTGFSTGSHLHYEVHVCQLPAEAVASGIAPGTINKHVGCRWADPEPFTK